MWFFCERSYHKEYTCAISKSCSVYIIASSKTLAMLHALFQYCLARGVQDLIQNRTISTEPLTWQKRCFYKGHRHTWARIFILFENIRNILGCIKRGHISLPDSVTRMIIIWQIKKNWQVLFKITAKTCIMLRRLPLVLPTSAPIFTPCIRLWIDVTFQGVENSYRDHLLIKDYLPTKFEAIVAKCSWVISWHHTSRR